MDTQNRIVDLTDDDLEQVTGGQVNNAAAKVCSDVAMAWGTAGSQTMQAYFEGMACGYGWC